MLEKLQERLPKESLAATLILASQASSRTATYDGIDKCAAVDAKLSWAERLNCSIEVKSLRRWWAVALQLRYTEAHTLRVHLWSTESGTHVLNELSIAITGPSQALGIESRATYASRVSQLA